MWLVVPVDLDSYAGLDPLPRRHIVQVALNPNIIAMAVVTPSMSRYAPSTRVVVWQANVTTCAGV
jgi:hypothetical protein